MSLYWLAVDPWFAAAIVLSALVGLSLGLLGSGGSILSVPVLVYVAGVPPRPAIPMSLAIVGTTSLLASGMHRSEGRVDARAAVLFAMAGMAGAVAGAQLTPLISPRTLLLSFGLLMIAVGAWMLVGGAKRVAKAGAGTPSTGRLLAAGVFVGMLTGFLGVGGGFLVVPALVLFAGLSMPTAVGTSLVVIAANSAAAFLSHLGEAWINPLDTIVFTGAAVAGAFAGFKLSGRLPADRLKLVFATAVIAVGLFVTVRNSIF